MLAVFWALVLVLVAAPCVAEPRDSDAWAAQRQPLWTVGGHAKYRFLFQTWPADSLLRDILGSTSSDHFFETRLKLAASRNRWDFQADYQFIAAHADTLQLAGQLPGSFFATGEIANDDRRWWDLTYSFDDGDRSAVVHRLDRLSVGFTTERAAFRFGVPRDEDLEFFTRFSAIFSFLAGPRWSHGFSVIAGMVNAMCTGPGQLPAAARAATARNPSDEPEAPETPVGARYSPKTSRSASSSTMSPAGVLVPCALT